MIKYKISIVILALLSTSSFAQDIEYWVTLGLENNPTNKAQKTRIEALEQAVESTFEWGETHFEVSAIEWMPDNISPYYRPTLSVTQELPWLGSKTIKKNLAEASIYKQQSENALLSLILEQKIREQYTELQYYQSKISLLKTHLEELTHLYDNLLYRVETGQANAWEVIVLENEINDLQTEISKSNFALAQHIKLFEILIATPIEDLKIEELNMNVDTPRMEISRHPLLARLEAEQNELEASQRHLDLDYAPKISIGIHYEAAMPVEPTYLTHDMIMPSLGISIPIFSNKKNSKKKLVTLQKEAINAEIELEKNTLNQEITKVRNALYGLELQWNSKDIKLQNLQEIRKLLWSEYEANKINFQEVNRIEIQAITVELEKLETNRDFNLQHIYLNYLTNNYF